MTTKLNHVGTALVMILYCSCSLFERGKKSSTHSEHNSEENSVIMESIERDGTVTSKYIPGTSTKQTLQAPLNSGIKGSSVTVLPGTLSIESNISLGEDLSEMGAQLIA